MGLLRNKILIILGLLLLVGGSVWIFIWFSGSKAAYGPAIKAVPVSAFCVFESQQASTSWKKFSQGNILWETLRETDRLNAFTKSVSAIDSLLKSSNDIAGLLENNPGWLSLHCTGNDELNWFFTTSLPRIGDESSVKRFVSDAVKQKPQETVFHKTTIYRFSGWGYALYEGTFLCSDNISLLEVLVDQLEKEESLLKDKAFRQVLETAGEKADANLYVHFDRVPLFLKRISNEGAHDMVDRLGYLAAWTEVDLTVKSNAALFNGFTATSDSARNYLSLFKNQKPQRIEMPSILPASTSNMLYFGFGSFPTYYNDYRNWLEKHGLGGERSSSILAVNGQYRINVEDYMTSWVGNEMALVTLSGNTILQERSYAVVAASNVAMAKEQLGKLKYVTDFIDREAKSHDDMLPDTSFYNGYNIRRIGMLHLVPLIYGRVFDQLDHTYYTIVGRYVVFANSADALKTFIISYENGKTLTTDRFYTDFSANLSTEANVFFYTAIGKSKPIYKTYASSTAAAKLENHDSMLQKLEAFGLQFSSNNGLFYTNAFIRHNNTETKQEATSLWEQVLDTTFHARPQLVQNHNTKTLDIFVQDDANTIYLISNTGTIWWKRKLPEPLMGEVQQVDALKNEKLQLVFNTASAVYVIDRNGKDLAGFPLKLPAPASNAMHVFDYDNNRDYRMLVACNNKKVYNYTIKGKPVEGWKFDGSVEPVVTPIQHVVIANKDYLVIADRSGRLYVTDRQGRTRVVLKQRLPNPLRQFIIEGGKDLARSYLISADSLGVFTRISFNDIPDNISFSGFGKNPAFDYQDFNDDGLREFILADSSRLAVFGPDKTVLVNYIFERAAKGNALFFHFGEKDNRIGRVCPEAGELYLINSGGVAAAGFPLFGETAFSIGNINNDGQLILVCGGKGKTLYAYPVK